MVHRLLVLVTLLLAAFGLAARDSSDYRKQKSQWSQGDMMSTPPDPASFAVLDVRFARDAVRGNLRRSESTGSGRASFVVVAENQARDRRHSYRCDTDRKATKYGSVRHLRTGCLERAGSQTCRSVVQVPASDRQRVDADDIALQVQDFSAVQVEAGQFSRDLQRGPLAHVVVDGYALDAKRLWNRSQTRSGPDTANFVVDKSHVGSADMNNRFRAWKDGQRVVVTK